VAENATDVYVEALRALAGEAQRLARRGVEPKQLIVCMNAFQDRLRSACANDLLQRSMFLADSRLGMIISPLAPSKQDQQVAAKSVSAIVDALAKSDRTALKAACLAHLEFCDTLIRRGHMMDALAA
jgi:DNA-binding GntR family transcriptional regulator